MRSIRRYLLALTWALLAGADLAPAIAQTGLTASGSGESGSSQTGSGAVTRGSFFGAMRTEYPDWFKESFLEFREDVTEAAAAGKRVMVLFHQEGCPYCNQLVEVNLAQTHIEQFVRENFDVVALNMWGDREVVSVNRKPFTEKTFAAALRVQFTPTIIFFDEQGQVALRLNGYLPPAQFMTALEYVATRKEKELAYADYLRERAPPLSSGTLHPQPYFRTPPYALDERPRSKPLAVFFEQRECPNCDTLHRRVLTDQETQRIIEQFEVVQLDMWSQTPVVTPQGKQLTAREWAQALGVTYAPTIVLFDQAGTEVIRSEALFKIFHTQSLFTYVLSGDYHHEPSFQRYLSERADQLRERGIDVNIWN